jgi:hypothetical protein
MAKNFNGCSSRNLKPSKTDLHMLMENITAEKNTEAILIQKVRGKEWEYLQKDCLRILVNGIEVNCLESQSKRWLIQTNGDSSHMA